MLANGAAYACWRLTRCCGWLLVCYWCWLLVLPAGCLLMLAAAREPYLQLAGCVVGGSGGSLVLLVLVVLCVLLLLVPLM